jgi:RNA polymerase sigma-70 factor (ECF subfamily)
MEDTKLLRLLHKDPNAGMEQLMNQYAGLVYAVISSRLADSLYVSSDIEDCVADTFSEFYTDLQNYDPKISSIRSYLCVLARNNATDLLRKRKKQQEEISTDDSENALQLADTVDIEGEIAEDELRREVLHAIKNLGEPDSSILIRKFYFGESSKDIANALKLTVSNVDTRTHRSLDKLRKIFGGKNA